MSRAATSTSASAASPATASSPIAVRGHGPGRGGGILEPQGGAPRLRPLESDQGGRGHQLGVALGPGAARLAHRVLGDGRAGAGRLVRRPRRRLGPRLPPPRERDRPVRVGRAALRPRLDAQRDGRRRGGEDVEIGGQHLPAEGGARPLRARGGRRLPGVGALSAAVGVRGVADGGSGGSGRAAAEFLQDAAGGDLWGSLGGTTAGRFRRVFPRGRLTGHREGRGLSRGLGG